MPKKKTVPNGQPARWSRVAFLVGGLAASAGIARSANPHPAGSPLARNWLAGWRTHHTATTRPANNEGPMTMDLIDKLPGMTDDDLGNLTSNAERLAQTGTPKQQHAAQAMLPAIHAEAVRRRDSQPAKRGTQGRRKATVSAQDA